MRGISYHDGQLHTTPNECSNFRARRNESVHDVVEVSNYLKDGIEFAGETSSPCISLRVEFGREGKNGVNIGDFVHAAKLAALIVGEGSLEFVQRFFEVFVRRRKRN